LITPAVESSSPRAIGVWPEMRQIRCQIIILLGMQRRYPPSSRRRTGRAGDDHVASSPAWCDARPSNQRYT
jgi:hypothetical protein